MDKSSFTSSRFFSNLSTLLQNIFVILSHPTKTINMQVSFPEKYSSYPWSETKNDNQSLINFLTFKKALIVFAAIATVAQAGLLAAPVAPAVYAAPAPVLAAAPVLRAAPIAVPAPIAVARPVAYSAPLAVAPAPLAVAGLLNLPLTD